jgi:two-component SAPR family response regulator
MEPLDTHSWLNVHKTTMTNIRPVVLVDDDIEDQELLLMSLQAVGPNYQVKVFSTAESALEYLYASSDQPFMILSDINMPRMDGIAFRKSINNCNILSAKCIPFVFLSTSTAFLKDTCGLNIQGYFEKGNSLAQLNDTVKTILSYWERTYHMLGS